MTQGEYLQARALLLEREDELNRALDRLQNARKYRRGEAVIAARHEAEEAERNLEQALAAAKRAWHEYWSTKPNCRRDPEPETSVLMRAEVII